MPSSSSHSVIIFFYPKTKILTVEVFKNVECDRLMSTHKKFVLKELRIMIYSQFLESYKSVTLGCMAEAFGVSEEFLDR